MNQQQLDELYFKWLYSLVADPDIEDRSMTYWGLLNLLHRKEFEWVVPNDVNRSEDGKELRREFVEANRLEDIDGDWTELGCSVMELMVGLARRLTTQADGEPHYWFWMLMENLGIKRYSDARRLPVKKINDVLAIAVSRNYERDGSGGFFPLMNPHRDQRKVELWYQMCAWVLELGE
jgi:hypothetical protein